MRTYHIIIMMIFGLVRYLRQTSYTNELYLFMQLFLLRSIIMLIHVILHTIYFFFHTFYSPSENLPTLISKGKKKKAGSRGRETATPTGVRLLHTVKVVGHSGEN